MLDDTVRRIGAVIPAAGLSSRMGAFKPLLPFNDGTVIEAAVGSALPYVVTLVVVVGYRGEEIKSALYDRFGDKVIIVKNPDYASSDMLASVKIGLRALGECDAFFLLPADMPLVAPPVYEALVNAFDGSDEIVVPAWNDRRGHPPLLAASMIPAILAYEGEGGLKAVFAGKRAREIAIGDSGILTDLDTPQDYRYALRAAKSCK